MTNNEAERRIRRLIQCQTAEKLKNVAAEIAAALEEIAHGTDDDKRRKAQAFIRDHVEGYHRAIKIGNYTELSVVLED